MPYASNKNTHERVSNKFLITLLYSIEIMFSSIQHVGYVCNAPIWLPCMPSLAAMHAFIGCRACLHWLPCMPSLASMHAFIGCYACLHWLPCMPSLAAMHAFIGCHACLQLSLIYVNIPVFPLLLKYSQNIIFDFLWYWESKISV